VGGGFSRTVAHIHVLAPPARTLDLVGHPGSLRSAHLSVNFSVDGFDTPMTCSTYLLTRIGKGIVSGMRVVTTGTDDAGRSLIVSVDEHTEPPAIEAVHEIFNDSLSVVTHLDRSGTFMDIAPSLGGAMWRVFDFSPGLVYDMHYTASIDFDVVIEGGITLGLDHGDIELVPGDCVLIRGDSHSWAAGEKGCRMLTAILGAPSEVGGAGTTGAASGQESTPSGPGQTATESSVASSPG